MLEAGVPFSVVAVIMGWSAGTTVRMARRYGHIGQASLRTAVAALSDAKKQEEERRIGPDSFDNPFDPGDVLKTANPN